MSQGESTKRIAIHALALAFAAAGCSSGGGSGNGPGNMEAGASDGGGISAGDSGLVSCASDPRVDPYALPLTKAGDHHSLTFSLVSSTADPPARGNETMKIKIVDGSGQPVVGATLTFPKLGGTYDPYMPDHHHGSAAPLATDNGDGTYTLTPLYFFMSGVWEVAIQAQSGSVTDGTMFTFCIP